MPVNESHALATQWDPTAVWSILSPTSLHVKRVVSHSALADLAEERFGQAGLDLRQKRGGVLVPVRGRAAAGHVDRGKSLR